MLLASVNDYVSAIWICTERHDAVAPRHPPRSRRRCRAPTLERSIRRRKRSCNVALLAVSTTSLFSNVVLCLCC